MRLALTRPPWVQDDNPAAWVTVQEAAAFYNRSVQQIRAWCRNGTFSEAHVPLHWDGHMWYIRLPRAVECGSKPGKFGKVRNPPPISELP